MKSTNKYEGLLDASEELGNLKEQVTKSPVQGNLCLQNFHYDAMKFFTTITKADKDTSEKLSEESESTTKTKRERIGLTMFLKTLE